jgi:HEPN domain-containing protein
MAMSAQEKYEYWLDAAQYDLGTAKAMLDGGRWLYVAFMCQQAIEKLVKNLYILYLDDNVPKSHNIRSIIGSYEDKLPMGIPLETRDLFVTLSTCYLNNRYPEYKDKLSAQIREPQAKELFSQTQEVFAWLLTLKP